MMTTKYAVFECVVFQIYTQWVLVADRNIEQIFLILGSWSTFSNFLALFFLALFFRKTLQLWPRTFKMISLIDDNDAFKIDAMTSFENVYIRPVFWTWRPLLPSPHSRFFRKGHCNYDRTLRIISPLMTIMTPKYTEIHRNCVVTSFWKCFDALYFKHIQYSSRIYSENGYENLSDTFQPVCLLQLHLWRMSANDTTTDLVKLFYDIKFMITSSSLVLCLFSNVMPQNMYFWKWTGALKAWHGSWCNPITLHHQLMLQNIRWN